MVKAKKGLGQNFLVDAGVVERIVRAAGVRAGETVLEIGPGDGALTERLVERAGRLVAVELDRELAPLLRERFARQDNFELIEGDALRLELCELIRPTSRAKVVANLPYYISTAVLQRLIEQRHCLTEMVLMLQREVVERITARPATSERGFLSVLVEAYCETEPLFDVSPGSFRPVPKVWSTVVRLSLRPQLAVSVDDEELLWRAVSCGFAQRRKTLFNNLRSATGELRSRLEAKGGPETVLRQAGLEPQRRAETLALAEWAQLCNAIG